MRARLATPVSSLFADPIQAGHIAAASDCLEAREGAPRGRFTRQQLAHLEAPLNLPWDGTRRAAVRRTIEALPELQLASFHVPASCESPAVEDGQYRLGGRVHDADAMLGHARENVRWLRATFGRRLLLAVENTNWFPDPAYDVVTDGEFLCELVRGLDLGLLLDTAHALITAHNRGLDHAAYLGSLPLERTVQLHVSRPDLSGPLARDAHELPDAACLDETRELTRTLPVLWASIEFYRDASGLLDALHALRQGVPVGA